MSRTECRLYVVLGAIALSSKLEVEAVVESSTGQGAQALSR